MNFGVIEALNLLGSLAFFIYGMKIMSESIQKVAGSKMREILSSMTSNRFKGVVTGFIITSLVQSSSATTVLVVSFVNAGLLSLTESIGVIMGANIGTTITAWLISIIGFKVKISSYALPIIALGFPLLFFNRDKVKSWGEVLIGFALLFMGLAFLKDAVPDLKSNPELLSFLSRYTNLGYLSILMFVGIGTLITIVVQSSSAAMALTLVMANNGWIPFELAAAMVLGENIGTTITANLAAIVGNVHAKRAAFAHFIFNVFGVIWISLLIYPVLGVINHYLTTSQGVSPYTDPTAIPIALSLFHTSFNITNTFLLIWFVPFIAQIVSKAVKPKGDDEEFRLEYIGTGFMSTAELSIEEARKETALFGKKMEKMATFLEDLLSENKAKKQKKLLKKIRKYEELSDQFEEEIYKYLLKLPDNTLSAASSTRLVSLLSIINDLERVGDVFYQISKDFESRYDSEVGFTNKQEKNLSEMVNLVKKSLSVMAGNLGDNYSSVSMDEAMVLETKINDLKNKLRKDLLKQMEDKKYVIPMGSLYKDIFQGLEKIGDHVINVTEAITGESERDLRETQDLAQ
ncbi:Na/Pi cotransporter family protein [Marinoscillum sp. MHG1-6]|uniref:Na/Pi cotransporter family protein n=1 Tax=Marinoscillum sp. MHG1-6 TaxID=2959627 RepID=UPI0021589221|nr:Na/Pi cotransporter family protein [Marinoscillum sp. MHG1-6]